ncbi:G-type lectin S-receptor-like serine/threonine-protein kinase [Heracleum sosnowskyi]|uniref:G-type lectin S-receptor-like serine/threonine-protein kinase n=1 Tax=Heracleum sosnowskyi TaxID=360622 RepID=A0AAD8IT87_9APIA|nr:G-type lectin S-receptor-like serine/threonine-protein kinase [Heracleum sosnowskyi]
MDATAIILLCSTLLSTLINSIAVDTIRANQTITDGETITSARGEFQLGFFSPGRSTNRYLGIWYKKISNGTVLWVANRDSPIKNNLGVVRVTEKGITLQTVDVTIWSSNVSKTMKNPIAQLLDSGNLVVRDDDHKKNNAKYFIWQSFDYPGDTLIAGMKAGIDLVTGLDRYYTSWKSADDPSTGSFTVRIDPNGFPQFFQFKGAARWIRTGPWNGRQFSGSPKLNPNGMVTENFVFSKEEIYYMFDTINSTSANVRRTITPNGDTKHLIWNYQKQIWIAYFTEMVSDCDTYGFCGANDICNINSSPRCECLRGFVPKFPDKWKTVDWSSGCVRKTELDCRTKVGFMKYSGVKLPDTRYSKYDMKISLEECGRLCLKNCNCTAYANADTRRGGSGCILWFNDLIDIKGYTADGQDIYVRMPASELGNSTSPFNIQMIEEQDSLRLRAKKPMWIIPISLVLTVLIALLFLLVLRKRKRTEEGKIFPETITAL